VRTFVAAILFLLASGMQYDCHAYLASLKTAASRSETERGSNGYRLPEHPAFHTTCTPHYFAECLIYLALALIAAPPGHLLNRSLVCALVFVVVNLGVTADGTRRWYEQKFGAAAVAGRARMIPFVF